VTLLNLSGAGWKDATLKLVAGDVQRVLPPEPVLYDYDGAPGFASDDRQGFEEKSFFEYHLYTLPRKTDVLDASTQQITLFPQASGVSVERVLVYDGLPEAAHWAPSPEPPRGSLPLLRSPSNSKVDVYVRWKNAKENRMGMPLPKGKVRVYEQDEADGTLEFVGEDLIDHTPRDEEVTIKVGQAFDVVGERTQTDFRTDTSRRETFDAYRIEVRNHKDAPVKVLVREHVSRWATWELVESNRPHENKDARTIEFPVEVPAHGKVEVTYRIRYTW
jgi:hypothetical protein